MLLPMLLLLTCASVHAAQTEQKDRLPNIVLIFCDDLAYADIGCFGAKKIKTPNLDRMAKQGIRLTSFCVAQAVCSASRAALLTGCYPNRVGILGALGPNAKTGIHANEVTMAEMLKARGYATGMVGKWHLGRPAEFLPTRHGFDEYLGLPYSNDMWPRHPQNPRGYPPLPLIQDETVIDAEVTPEDQTQLTTRYTERAVSFIERNRERPFFLYLAHSMPHVPIYVSAQRSGKSKAGLFGDVIQEIDWSVGQVLAALKKHRLDERTLVVFTSDNGPWLPYGNHAGSAGPFREGKGSSFEGGVREPFIARWPGKIPAGKTSDALALSMDLFPTFAALTGGEVPKDRVIDGKDIWPLLAGRKGAKSPHEAFYYYWAEHLQAVRSGKWKLHFPHAYPHVEEPGADGKPGKTVQRQIGRELFDLESDIGETTNVADKFPDVVARLEALAEQAREDLGDSATKRQGKNVRPSGRVP